MASTCQRLRRWISRMSRFTAPHCTRGWGLGECLQRPQHAQRLAGKQLWRRRGKPALKPYRVQEVAGSNPAVPTLIICLNNRTYGRGGTVYVPAGTWMAVASRTDAPVVALGVLTRGEVRKKTLHVGGWKGVSAMRSNNMEIGEARPEVVHSTVETRNR